MVWLAVNLSMPTQWTRLVRKQSRLIHPPILSTPENITRLAVSLSDGFQGLVRVRTRSPHESRAALKVGKKILRLVPVGHLGNVSWGTEVSCGLQQGLRLLRSCLVFILRLVLVSSSILSPTRSPKTRLAVLCGIDPALGRPDSSAAFERVVPRMVSPASTDRVGGLFSIAGVPLASCRGLQDPRRVDETPLT